MNVPLLEIDKMHAPIREELAETVLEVLDSCRYINGPYVEEFEEILADYCGTKKAIGVSSGSDALILGMMALGIQPGDEVITTPFTFFATVGAISRLGAKPVFVDVNEQDFNIDAEKIEAKITDKTVGIIPVSLFGQMAYMDPINQIAQKHNLWVMEDAAQSIGATYNGHASGSMSTLGTFSFFPAKNLGGIGDGGAIVTQDEAFAERCKVFRNHGGKSLYFYEFIGGNFRLDALQAAVLKVKLPHLKSWEETRRKNAKFYNESFVDLQGCFTPVEMTGRRHVYNQYTIRVPKRRDALKSYLAERGIGHAVYYPLCLHQQACFSYLGHSQGDFPMAESCADEVISLPIWTDKVEKVAEVVRSFFHEG